VPLTPPDDVTIAPFGSAQGTPLGPSGLPMPGSSRFAPGAIVAGRYRLVALLGRGGMGEVYRAEDLTLDHPVALKFLPESTASNPASLAQFHNELRVARQVSHKNVCRLHDLGEAEGRRFLTMEYVDGEDLASLVHRIGRVQQDKAIDIARQICAGLAAAHERGVLHRDLKPANVMLDGEGNVRITDFGLSISAGDADAVRAGTPQYMAPEQLAPRSVAGHGLQAVPPATIKSDIYALGLVLFEIFTGRRAFEAKTLRDLLELHESGAAPLTPSSVVRDLDPAVERIIMRCLERDPDRRPGSALAVAAALPGANPLAEALAAGETPSPDLLVAAGEAEALPFAPSLGIVALIICGLVVCVALATRASFVRLGPLDKPPAVLIDRAEQILTTVGYAEPRGDIAYGLGPDLAYLLWIERTDRSPRRWAVLANGIPASTAFWYRTSPSPMMSAAQAFTVTSTDPPARESHSHRVLLDAHGRLLELRSTPVQFDPTPARAGSPPWSYLFDMAGLSIAEFKPVSPQWTPADFADARAAWEGPLGGRPEITMRVEAAAYRDQPVYFVVLGPWNQPTRMLSGQAPLLQQLTRITYRLAIITLVVAAVVLARHNTRIGRADMRGATRFAVVGGLVELAGSVIGGHHVSDVVTEYHALVFALEEATFQSVVLWTVYLALEPYGRRFWPDMLLGWSRLLSGHVRDARVGREVLAGVACGVLFVLIHAGRLLLPQMFGYAAPRPDFGMAMTVLLGQGSFVRYTLLTIFREFGLALLVTLVFVVARLVARRTVAAIAVGMAVMFYAWSDLGAASALWLEVLLEITAVGVLALVTIRFGLLASAVALFVASMCVEVPLTFDAAHWSAAASNSTLAIVAALALYGFYASRAGRPVFGSLADY
jgi:hypothetical protein